jgi:predicted ribosome quality control (RQC) complex YloA/Tae2 family protein
MTNASFRKLVMTSGKLVLSGKDAETNEQLIKQVGNNEWVLHTSKPGSPFVNIKAVSKEVSRKDIMEAAIFCSFYSQAWKKAKKKADVKVDYFLGNDIFKLPGMKPGTFGVRKGKSMTVKKQYIEEFSLKNDKI